MLGSANPVVPFKASVSSYFSRASHLDQLTAAEGVSRAGHRA